MAFALEGKLGLNTRDFVKGADKAARAVDDIGDEFGKLPKDAGKAADGIEDEMGKLPAAGDKIGDKFGGKLGTSLVAGFGAVGVGALLQQSISQALEADTVERTMQGKFAATTKEAEQFGKIAGDLYADGWGGGIAEVADVVGTAAQQLELETGSALEAISGQVIATSQTFGEDFEAVIRSTSQLIENDLAPNAEEALDLIVGGFQNGGNQAGDLLDTIDEYSQHFAAMGFSGEDAMQLIIDGFQNGQRDADKMADAVKEMRLRATEDSEKIDAAYQSLGLNADKTRKKFLEGGEAARYAYDDVITALQSVEDPVEQNRLAVELIGTQYEDLGPKALDTLGSINEAYDPVIGDAEQLAETVEATDWVKLQRRAEQSLTPIGDALIFLGNDFLAFQEKVGDWGDSFGATIGISKNWEAQLTDDIESVNKFMKEFDKTQLKGMRTFDQVHAHLVKQGKAFLSDEDAIRAANEMAVEWNETTKHQIESGEKAVAMLRTNTEEYWKSGGAARDAADDTEDLADATDDVTGAAERATAAFARMSGELSDRSAFLSMEEGFARLRAELKESGEVSEQTTIRMKQDVIDYATEVGNIPPEVVTRINALIDEGNFARAEAALAQLERQRQSTLTVTVRARDERGNATGLVLGGGKTAIIALAEGTDYHQGGIALVGEEGPELVNLPRGSQVHTATDTARMARPVAPMIPPTVTQAGMDTDALARAVTAAMPATMILDVEGRQMTAHVRDVMRTADEEKAGAL